MKSAGSQRLMEWKLKHSLSIGKLSQILNCSTNTLGHWLHGRTTPWPRVLEQIEKLCGIPIDAWTTNEPPKVASSARGSSTLDEWRARQRPKPASETLPRATSAEPEAKAAKPPADGRPAKAVVRCRVCGLGIVIDPGPKYMRRYHDRLEDGILKHEAHCNGPPKLPV